MNQFLRTLGAVALLALVALPASAATWTVDTSHSTLEFKIRHLLAKTSGEFADWTGTIVTAGDDLTDSTVEIVIQTASIDTDNDDRDNHLRSEDFFHVEKYPTITFTSTKVVKTGENEYDVHGQLAMRGVTRDIVIPMEFHGTGKDPWGNTKAGFSGEVEINRKDFDIVWNKAIDQGGVLLGDDVEIEIEINAVQTQSGR